MKKTLTVTVSISLLKKTKNFNGKKSTHKNHWIIDVIKWIIDKALYKLTLILDTLNWHLSIILPDHKSFPQISCFVWESRKMRQKLLVLEFTKVIPKCTRVGTFRPKILCVCIIPICLFYSSARDNSFSLKWINLILNLL